MTDGQLVELVAQFPIAAVIIYVVRFLVVKASAEMKEARQEFMDSLKEERQLRREDNERFLAELKQVGTCNYVESPESEQEG